MLLENDLIRVWRFELDAGSSCHAHQHVYPYFFYNLLPAQTRRLEWAGGGEPAAGALTPKCPPNTAAARKVFWLDTVEGGTCPRHSNAPAVSESPRCQKAYRGTHIKSCCDRPPLEALPRSRESLGRESVPPGVTSYFLLPTS